MKKGLIILILMWGISFADFLEITQVEVLPKKVRVHVSVGSYSELSPFEYCVRNGLEGVSLREGENLRLHLKGVIKPNMDKVFEFDRYKYCGHDLASFQFRAYFVYSENNPENPAPHKSLRTAWKYDATAVPFVFPDFREPTGGWVGTDEDGDYLLDKSALWHWSDLYFEEDRLLFGFKIGWKVFRDLLENFPPIIENNRWQHTMATPSFGRLDAATQSIDIDLDMWAEKFEEKPFSGDMFSLGEFRCDGVVKIAPYVGELSLEFGEDTSYINGCVGTDGLIKILGPKTTDKHITDKVRDKLKKMELNTLFGSLNSMLNNPVVKAQIDKKVNFTNNLLNLDFMHQAHLKITPTGFWIIYDIDVNYVEEVKNIVNAVQDKDFIQVIKSTKDLIDAHAMQGFNLDKINSSQKNLIVSLSGAGVWNDAYTTGEGPIDTYIAGDLLTSTETFGDGTYKLPYTHVNKNTVSIIGYPWLNAEGALDFVAGNGNYDFINDYSWGPNHRTYAQSIQAALDKMGSGSKLILLGKSLGGCKMQKIVNELNALKVDVDLLILVDPSCYYADQSQVVKPVYGNVKKVYNFRQISAPGHNDGQNGFQISYQSPTSGHDIIVSDEGNNIGNLMCEGTGHNDVDECTALQEKIQELIEDELKVRIDAIINMLLLD